MLVLNFHLPFLKFQSLLFLPSKLLRYTSVSFSSGLGGTTFIG